MKNNNRGFWWAFGILAVILIVVIAVSMNKRAAVVDTDNAADTSMTDDQNVLEATEDVTAGSVNAGASTPVPVLSYQAALTKYATARIQLNASCQATPNNPTYKNGANIMLDNRSAQPRVIHLGSLGNVSIKAWGFKIVNLSSSLLPNAMAMDCGTQQNVAIITIQK